MSVLIDQFPVILQGFWMTIRLTAFAALIALVFGTVLAAMRVSPTPPLRMAATGYVEIVRNTPLTLVFVLMVFGLPELGFRFSFFVRAVISLSLYTAAFEWNTAGFMFTACPVGFQPSVRFAVENKETIGVSLYNCVAGRPTS